MCGGKTTLIVLFRLLNKILVQFKEHPAESEMGENVMMPALVCFDHKSFTFSELTLQTLIYPVQFLCDKDPFLKYSHIYNT